MNVDEVIKDNYEGWKANIAMAFYDAYANFKEKQKKQYISKTDLHRIANEAADNFLNHFKEK